MMENYLKDSFDDVELEQFNTNAIHVIKVVIDYISNLNNPTEFNFKEIKSVIVRNMVTNLPIEDELKEELTTTLQDKLSDSMIKGAIQNMILHYFKTKVISIYEKTELSDENYENQLLKDSSKIKTSNIIIDVKEFEKYPNVFVIYLKHDNYTELDISNRTIKDIDSLGTIIELQYYFDRNDYNSFNGLIKGKDIEVLKTLIELN